MRARVAIAGLAALALSTACALFEPPPAWEQDPPPVQDGPVVQPGQLQRSALANGMQIVVLEDPSLPRAALGVVVRRGSADVGVAEAGLASYTVELMRRGAGDRDALALAESVDTLGASLTTSAGWDSSTVRISGLSRDFDALFEIVADVVLHPRFDPGEAERLRSQRLASLERAKDDPDTLARWNLAALLFPDHPFGLPAEGTPETAASFDAEAAIAHYARTWVPGDAILYATGAVRAEEVRVRAEELFGSWSGEVVPSPQEPPRTPAPPERRVRIVDRPDLGQAQIVVGHEGIRRTADDRVATSIMNLVVGGGGFSSRIMTRVRENAGLAYFAYSGFGMRREGGVFVAATATRVPEAGRAVEMVLEVIDGARTGPPTEDEIRLAKSLAVGRFALGLETSDAVIAQLVELDVFGLPQDSLDTYRSRVRGLESEEVAAVARRHLHPERAGIVVVGPAETLKPQLERFGPVEVVTP